MHVFRFSQKIPLIISISFLGLNYQLVYACFCIDIVSRFATFIYIKLEVLIVVREREHDEKANEEGGP